MNNSYFATPDGFIEPYFAGKQAPSPISDNAQIGIQRRAQVPRIPQPRVGEADSQVHRADRRVLDRDRTGHHGVAGTHRPDHFGDPKRSVIEGDGSLHCRKGMGKTLNSEDAALDRSLADGFRSRQRTDDLGVEVELAPER